MAYLFNVPIATNVYSDLLPEISKGSDLSWLGKVPDAYWQGQDQAYKQAQQDVFKDRSLYDPATGQLDFQKAARRLLQVGGAPALQSFIGLQNIEEQRKLPPLVEPSPYPSQQSRVELPPSTSRALPMQSDAQPSSAADVGGERLPPGDQGNLTSSSEVPGSFRVYGETPEGADTFANRFTGESQQPDNRYPPQFQVQPKPVPTQTIRPQSALPQEALDARAEVPQLQAQAQIPGIPTQPQGSMNEATAKRLEDIANVRLEAARRADMAGNKGMAEDYRAAAGQASARAQAIREGLIKTQVKQGEVQIDQEKAILDEGHKSYEAAKNTQYRLGLINESIKNLGPVWMGAGADARATAARSFNTMRNLLPKDAQDLVPEINSGKIATWEDFNKQTQTLGFELAKTLGSREAMQIVQQATKSVPNVQQSYWGARLVSSALGQAAQRQEDYQKYLIQLRRSGQSLLDADINFNQTHPVSNYISSATSVVPPQRAIQFLQANPSPQNKKAFDQKYGDGATIGVFGTQQ